MNIPRATYRLQLQADFGFARAAEIIPYLDQLGISHIYASPVFRARPGSGHGYDCVDPNALNPELGSQADWDNFVAQLRAHDMGLLLDIVPNHMAFDYRNPLLADVLENGPASRFRDFFDILWDHPSRGLQGRVMAPFLGRPYAACLREGEIRLSYDAEGFAASYGDLKFPLRLESYPPILEQAMAFLEAAGGGDNADYRRLVDAIDEIKSLTLEDDPEVRSRRARAARRTLWALHSGSEDVGRSISEVLRRFNPADGDSEGSQLLDRLLSRQHFKLCHWKKANREINYRRFFDINELISVRQEIPAVFEFTHTLLAGLAAKNTVTGARVDHIDGLADPEDYLRRLRHLLGGGALILVEKILAAEEALPDRWPVQGTTGYDFGHWLNALFVRRDNEKRFDRIYSDFSGRGRSFAEVVCRAKMQILQSRLSGDLDNLTRRLEKLCGPSRPDGCFTADRLRQALSGLLARFPVYRTYIGAEGAAETDRMYVRRAASKSVGDRPDLRVEIEFVRDLLLGRGGFAQPAEKTAIHKERLPAVRAFQQLSSALMAKGFEDTAFYRYHRLVSSNEVGGEPDQFGCSVERFHAFVAGRAGNWPHAMNSTATHDSKRGEDVRARLNVLSEIPADWEAQLGKWHALNRDRRVGTGRGPVPGKNAEYLLYQTLAGSWPLDGAVTKDYVERIQAYTIKAAREAGERTSWTEPRADYESGLEQFTANILEDTPQNRFMQDFAPFCAKIAFYGLFNSLSQCVLKTAAPGIPDFYQGTELSRPVLVDPDNRRPVSYARRRRLLEAVGSRVSDAGALLGELLQNKNDGRIKLFVVARALAVRRRWEELFKKGRYLPLETGGVHRRRIVAFARVLEGRWCIAVVPRFLTGLVTPPRDPLGTSVWDDTEVVLPAGAPRHWQNQFTRQGFQAGESIAAGAALEQFPVALLTGGQD